MITSSTITLVQIPAGCISYSVTPTIDGRYVGRQLQELKSRDLSFEFIEDGDSYKIVSHNHENNQSKDLAIFYNMYDNFLCGEWLPTGDCLLAILSQPLTSNFATCSALLLKDSTQFDHIPEYSNPIFSIDGKAWQMACANKIKNNNPFQNRLASSYVFKVTRSKEIYSCLNFKSIF